jgi:hypothetical protein
LDDDDEDDEEDEDSAVANMLLDNQDKYLLEDDSDCDEEERAFAEQQADDWKQRNAQEAKRRLHRSKGALVAHADRFARKHPGSGVVMMVYSASGAATLYSSVGTSDEKSVAEYADMLRRGKELQDRARGEQTMNMAGFEQLDARLQKQAMKMAQ